MRERETRDFSGSDIKYKGGIKKDIERRELNPKLWQTNHCKPYNACSIEHRLTARV